MSLGYEIVKGPGILKESTMGFPTVLVGARELCGDCEDDVNCQAVSIEF